VGWEPQPDGWSGSDPFDDEEQPWRGEEPPSEPIWPVGPEEKMYRQMDWNDEEEFFG